MRRCILNSWNLFSKETQNYREYFLKLTVLKVHYGKYNFAEAGPYSSVGTESPLCDNVRHHNMWLWLISIEGIFLSTTYHAKVNVLTFHKIVHLYFFFILFQNSRILNGVAQKLWKGGGGTLRTHWCKCIIIITIYTW